MVRFRSPALAIARLGAVAFALTVLVFLVVLAQRQADSNAPAAGRSDAAPIADRAAAEGSKPAVRAADVSDFVPIDTSTVESRAFQRVFLPSSKSAPVDAMELLEVWTPPAEGNVDAGTEGSAPIEPPVFLPSSKVLGIGAVLRPVLKPGDLPAPAKTDAEKPAPQVP